MPHQHPDLLLPGETLHVGESLVSKDERFHLYLEEDGRLVSYMYGANGGVYRYWRSEHAAGPGATLRCMLSPNRNGGASPAFGLFSSSGELVWGGVDSSYRQPTWGILFLAIQSDGNIVFYGKSTTNVVKALWSPPGELWRIGSRNGPVAPNSSVVQFEGTGVLSVETGAGNADIINNGGGTIGVDFGNEYVAVPANDSQSILIPPLTVSIIVVSYEFTNLRAPDHTRAVPRRQDSAIPNRPPSGRLKILVGDGGFLTLRGMFARPELEGLGEIVIVGENSHVPERDEESKRG